MKSEADIEGMRPNELRTGELLCQRGTHRNQRCQMYWRTS